MTRRARKEMTTSYTPFVLQEIRRLGHGVVSFEFQCIYESDRSRCSVCTSYSAPCQPVKEAQLAKKMRAATCSRRGKDGFSVLVKAW